MCSLPGLEPRPVRLSYPLLTGLLITENVVIQLLASVPLTAATMWTHNRQTFIEQTHRRLKSHLAVGSRLRQRLHQLKSENSPNLLSSIPLTAATTGTHNRPTFIELWFHSNWYQNSMQLQEVDALELCPQGQFWPKCMWCGKFHLPYESHRGSHRSSHAHRRFCAKYIRRIEVEEPGSARREQLSSNLRQAVRAYRPVADMAQMFAP